MELDDATMGTLVKRIYGVLKRATIETVSVTVDEYGRVVIDELTLKTEGGKRVGVADVVLDVFTEDEEWCEAYVGQDFREELAAALTAPGGGATPPAGVRQGDRSERMKETIRYETYDGHNCRSYVGDEITEQIALRRARGYAWFEYHDLPIAAREELGDSPTLAAVRECVRGTTTGARV